MFVAQAFSLCGFDLHKAHKSRLKPVPLSPYVRVSAMRYRFLWHAGIRRTLAPRLAAHPGISVEAVITQPDRPAAAASKSAALPSRKPRSKPACTSISPKRSNQNPSQEFLKRVAPDAVVIIAYGQIVPARLLDDSPLGWINLHASLLPRYRGAAPIHWAIANGETRTGLTTMQIDAGMDTGPILLQREIEIGPDETAPELSARMSEVGAGLIVESLLKFDRGEISPTPQDPRECLLRADPEKRRRPDRLVAHRSANLQPHARLHSLAWSIHHISRANVPFMGPSGDARRSLATAPNRAKSSLKQICCMLFVAKERVCDWNPSSSKAASGVSAQEFANGARLTSGERFV